MLDCGTRLFDKYVKIRPELDYCKKVSEKPIAIKLSDNLAQFLSVLPDSWKLPCFESKTDAGMKLLRDIMAKLIDSPLLTKMDQLEDIKGTIALDLKILKQTLIDKLERNIPLRLSLMLTIIVFVGNFFAIFFVDVHVPLLCHFQKLNTKLFSSHQKGRSI